nr:MAG TPA_asm: hypothetical protein [Caudoviricetes sp.]
MFYHRVRCTVQAFGLDSLVKVQAVRCYPRLPVILRHTRELAMFCRCPLDILNCTTRDFVCQELFSFFLDFFSLALRLALRCPVGHFLILIIAAISKKSRTNFEKIELFF